MGTAIVRLLRRLLMWLRIRYALAFLLVFLVVAFFVLLLFNARGQKSLAIKGTDVISADNLNFGETWAEDCFKWTVYLTNPTLSEIEISGFRTSCGCAKVQPSSLVIPPRGKANITLTLTLGGKYYARPLHELHPVSIQVAPLITGIKPGSFVWLVEGQVKNPVLLSASSVFFGEDDYAIEEHECRTRTVSFECAFGMKSINVIVEPPCVVARGRLETPKFGVLELVPKDDLSVDHFECEVRLILESMNGQSCHTVSLPVSGKVVRDIQVIPDSVFFKPSHLGDRVETTILLKSRSGSQFSVQSVECDSKDTLIEPVSCTILNGRAYHIRHRISAVGSHTTTVEFTVVDKSTGAHQIRLQANCVGLP